MLSVSQSVFRGCNEFCTVLSRKVLNRFTLQMCFCISARLYLVVSFFSTIYSIFSLIRPNTERAFIVVVAIFGWRTFSAFLFPSTSVILMSVTQKQLCVVEKTDCVALSGPVAA